MFRKNINAQKKLFKINFWELLGFALGFGTGMSCPDLEIKMTGPGRVGAQSGLGPGPGWGPYGPLWAHRAFMVPYGSDFI